MIRWKKIFLSDSVIEVLYSLYKVNDMFNFLSDIKARLTSLEQRVEAIFSHIHTQVAADAVKAAQAVEAVPVNPTVAASVETAATVVEAAPNAAE